MSDSLTRRCRPLAALALAALCSTLAAAQSAVPVAVARATEQPVYKQVQITGSVTSPQVAQLSTATAGLVTELLAEEGDRVSSGATLLKLDDELARQQLASAEAQVKQGAIAATDAERRLKEAETLGPRGGIAATLIEDIRAEVAEDKAALARFRADAGLRRAILERHTLKAPFDGIVSRRLADVGEWVTTGQGVFELVATDNLRLDFYLAEDFLHRISDDTQIDFRFNALPGQQFSGRVQSVVPVADPGARTFLLRVVPAEDVEKMMPGLSVTATLRNPTDTSALAIPEDAVLRHPDGRVVVWTVDDGADGTVATERPVTTGNSFAGLVAILDGLAPGARVIIQGNEALQNGQPVTVVPANGRE